MDTTNTIETNGWDTVYAVPFSLINESILSKSSLPGSFSKSETTDDGTITFSGTFGKWQLTTGGDGQHVFMSLPITAATFVSANKNTQFANIEATIQVNLSWVADPTDMKYQNLIINNNENTVKVMKIDFKDNADHAMQEGFMKQLLHEWLGDNISSFRDIFATVNVNEVADTGPFAWMNPTSVAYAVTDRTDNTDGILGILCMTEGRQMPGMAQIPPNAIPDGATSALLIAPERVVDKIFFPNIKYIFEDASVKDFAITTTKLGITNTNQLHFTKQQMDDGTDKDIYIEAGNFTFALLADKITIEFNDLYFNWNKDLSVHFNHHSPATLTFPKGVPNLKITGSNTDVNTQATDGYFIGEIAGSIAAAILGAVVGGLIGGALAGGSEAAASAAAAIAEDGAADAIAMSTLDSSGQTANAATNIAPAVIADIAAGGGNRFTTFFAQAWAKSWGGIIGSVIGGVIGAVPVSIMEILKAVASGTVPDLTDFGTAMLTPVTWPDTATTAGFEVTDGALNGALQIGINWKAPKS